MFYLSLFILIKLSFLIAVLLMFRLVIFMFQCLWWLAGSFLHSRLPLKLMLCI